MIVVESVNKKPKLAQGDVGYSIIDENRILYIGTDGINISPIGFVELDEKRQLIKVNLSTTALPYFLATTSEVDPVFTAWLSVPPDISIFTNDAGYIISETDPVFLAAKDTDGTLTANSDSKWATQKAVKTYVDANVGGGDMVLIASGTVSGASTLDLTLNTSSYSIYKLVIYDYVAQTNNTDMWLRVGTGGTPVYQSGGSDYTYYYQGSFGAYGLGDSKIVLLRSSNNTFAQRMEVEIYNPAGTTYKKKIKWDGSCNDSASTTYNYKQYGDGLYNTNTNAITGLRIMQSSGNITYCEYRLYGMN